jgi:hypothetical protein
LLPLYHMNLHGNILDMIDFPVQSILIVAHYSVCRQLFSFHLLNYCKPQLLYSKKRHYCD